MDIIEIYQLAGQCRRLADKGARFNEEEAELFAQSLHLHNLEQCERLIETLKQRVTA